MPLLPYYADTAAPRCHGRDFLGGLLHSASSPVGGTLVQVCPVCVGARARFMYVCACERMRYCGLVGGA